MEVFNVFPTTICVGEMSDHQNYKKNFYDVYHKFDYEEDDVNNTVSENVGNPLIHHEDCLDDLFTEIISHVKTCLLYTSPSPRDRQKSRMPSSA